MRTALASCLLAACSVSALAAPQSDESYLSDGLTVVYRTAQVVYTVDAQRAEATDQGVRLWLQTDFAKPQAITSKAGLQSRNLAQADVDCVAHRVSFSQIRYYAENGDLVASTDAKTAWLTPKAGSVGQTLVRQICTGFSPRSNAVAASATAPRLPANAVAQTHSLQTHSLSDQVPSQP